ncbi:MAG: hypothetical protein ACI9W2_000507 [Gammaproteobacteria bacterium]|jgi:hypothetical protein
MVGRRREMPVAFTLVYGDQLDSVVWRPGCLGQLSDVERIASAEACKGI